MGEELKLQDPLIPSEGNSEDVTSVCQIISGVWDEDAGYVQPEGSKHAGLSPNETLITTLSVSCSKASSEGLRHPKEGHQVSGKSPDRNPVLEFRNAGDVAATNRST